MRISHKQLAAEFHVQLFRTVVWRGYFHIFQISWACPLHTCPDLAASFESSWIIRTSRRPPESPFARLFNNASIPNRTLMLKSLDMLLTCFWTCQCNSSLHINNSCQLCQNIILYDLGNSELLGMHNFFFFMVLFVFGTKFI